MVHKNTESSSLVQCCLVGDGLVGKSYLAKSFLRQTLPQFYEATLFENVAGKLMLKDEQHTISIFDTAGQHDFESIRAFTYNQCDVIVVCFSLADHESFRNIKEFWIPEIRRYTKYKKPVVLLGTQSDCVKRETEKLIIVESDEGHKLADEIGAEAFLTCSAYDSASITRVFESLVDLVFRRSKRKHSIIKKFFRRLS